MVKPSSIRVVESEGMPVSLHHSQNLTYGNLYIKFKVKFPEELDAEICRKLKDLMPSSSPVNIDRYVSTSVRQCVSTSVRQCDST